MQKTIYINASLKKSTKCVEGKGVQMKNMFCGGGMDIF